MKNLVIIVEILCIINAIKVQYVIEIAEQSKEINVLVTINLLTNFSNNYDISSTKEDNLYGNYFIKKVRIIWLK